MSTYTSTAFPGLLLLQAPPALSAYCAAYYLPSFSGGNSLSTAEAWEAGGLFLFLKLEPDELQSKGQAFLRQLNAWLQDPVNRDLRLLWLANPLAPMHEWEAQSMLLAAPEKAGDTAWRLVRPAFIEWRNYSLLWEGGGAIDLTEDGLRLVQGQAHLQCDYGRHRIGLEQAHLFLEGSRAGCLGGQLSLAKQPLGAGAYGYPDLEPLDVGFRLFMRDPEFPTQDEEAYLSSHRYALLSEASKLAAAEPYYPERLPFALHLDPLDPLNRQRRTSQAQDIRSYLQFLPLDTAHAQTGIPTTYRTNIGYHLHVLPEPEAAQTASTQAEYAHISRLVFAQKPLSTRAQEAHPYYLTPSGDFIMQVPRYQASPERSQTGALRAQEFEDSVVCGISGLEYIKLTPGYTDLLHFRPGQPAFVPGHVSTAAMLRKLPELLEAFSPELQPPYDFNASLEVDLGLGNEALDELLAIFLVEFFPAGFRLSTQQRSSYEEVQSLEDLIEWLRRQLKTLSYDAPDGLLTNLATTSWAYVRQAEAEGHGIYYAQPERSILYQGGQSRQFLDFMEVPTVGLPDALPQAPELLAFPFLPYGEVEEDILSDYLELESQVISKLRRSRVQEIAQADQFRTALLLRPGTRSLQLPTGTTPQGLIATFSADFTRWERLLLARYLKDNPNEQEGDMSFQGIPVDSPLKAALQSNPLMMVVSDPASIRAYFQEENELMIDGWNFLWGTEYWQDQGEKPDTILIFKYQNKSLLELAAQPEAWTLGEAFNQELQTTSQQLVRLLEKAVATAASEDAKSRRKYQVLARAATLPTWTGILALNVHVPQRGLPTELKALAAGIDPAKFYAQYVGIDITPIDIEAQGSGNQLTPKPSSLFGLIDYDNPGIPLADESGYNFHVPSLSVVFQNSAITDFSAEVLLVMDRLFGEPTQLYEGPEGRNIITLKGTAERHNDEVTYSFGFSGANHFLLPESGILNEVEIVKAQFATDPIPELEADPLPVVGRFLFWGKMKFAYESRLDALSFGPPPGSPLVHDPAGEPEVGFLSFHNAQVVLSFDLQQEANQVINKTLSFQAKQLAFDLVRSSVRPHSLYAKFPLKLTGWREVILDENALVRSGFMPVKSPLGSDAQLGESWYGLTFDLNLGSLGALTDKAGLVVSLLLAWSPSTVEGGRGLYIGLKLPGATGGKREISLQGVLKIVFKSIQLVAYPLDPNEDPFNLPEDQERELGYLLKLKNIILKVLVLNLPPSGQTELVLFGDPRSEVAANEKLVGWYGAYTK